MPQQAVIASRDRHTKSLEEVIKQERSRNASRERTTGSRKNSIALTRTDKSLGLRTDFVHREITEEK